MAIVIRIRSQIVYILFFCTYCSTEYQSHSKCELRKEKQDINMKNIASLVARYDMIHKRRRISTELVNCIKFCFSKESYFLKTPNCRRQTILSLFGDILHKRAHIIP